ncbi:MAG: M20/M25/M40 family metallo-hydrolase [Ardenticatenales bacterium]|nr:M20/M25/M40 family metallo-hydrolase [Ardenticatenales bacterium]
MSFSRLWNQPSIQAACSHLGGIAAETEQDTITIQQIPAPTFSEKARAIYVRERLEALGVSDLMMDEAGNVTARLPGQQRGPGLLLTAHLDTVFSAETDLSVRRQGQRLYGPGIGDNSLAVAGLLTLAKQLRAQPLRRDIWLAANVGEEGLGNLNGMWTVVRRLEKQLGAVIVLEGGAYGTIIHRGIGVKRRQLIVETAGGHAWSDFGTPSAIHELCRLGGAIAALTVPEEPRTSFNLGVIEGGTSINTIAARASALLDMRSEEPTALQRLEAQVDRLVAQARRSGVTVTSKSMGDRPAGGISPTHPLVGAAVESLAWLEEPPPSLRAASTDANVPLALGLPAVCIGLTVGHNAHRLDEYVELGPLKNGVQHVYLVIVAALEIIAGGG